VSVEVSECGNVEVERIGWVDDSFVRSFINSLGRRLCDEDPEQTVGKRKLMGQLYSAPAGGWMDGWVGKKSDTIIRAWCRSKDKVAR